MEALVAGLVLFALLTLPGWAVLATGDTWRDWAPLQRWCLAICLSLAVYPIVFYSARLIPGLTLGPLKLGALLVLSGSWALWRLRGQLGAQFALDRLEWLAVGLVALTLLTRLWIIRAEPYPAWSDSLHHTLLTELTAVQGRLPATLEPYFPIPLGQYHLGLYALSGSIQMLARVPAHTALLLSAQALNGLCGLGVYLVLDRKVGRVGALAGLVAVGFLSRMPAWYVNWGRFTQLASQTLLLAAWLVVWEALATWRQADRTKRNIVLRLMAVVLIVGMALLHFRVAAFGLPLLVAVALWELYRASRAGRIRRILWNGALLALLVALLAGPVLIEAAANYARPLITPVQTAETAQYRAQYFHVPLDAIRFLTGPDSLLVLAAIAALVGLWRRQWLAGLSLGWLLALLAMGYAYLLNVPLLSFTNLGAVLIMFYLPLALLIGVAVQALVASAVDRGWQSAVSAASALTFAAGLLLAPARATAREPYRYFVTPADLPAMEWIKANTPPEAVFAVNSQFWLPRAPIGTDAGYWIPYLTGRRTTASTMLMNEADWTYEEHIVRQSQAEERLEAGEVAALDELRQLGVQYVFIGARGDFSGPGLDANWLRQQPDVWPVYDSQGVSIFSLNAPGHSQ